MSVLLFIFLHSSYAVQPESQSLLQTTVALETKFLVTLPNFTPYETQVFQVNLKVVNVNGATTPAPKGNITVSIDGVDYFPVKVNYASPAFYYLGFNIAANIDRPLLAGTHHVVAQFLPSIATQSQASTAAFDLVIAPDVRPTPVIQLSLAQSGNSFPFGTLVTFITTFDVPIPLTNLVVKTASSGFFIYGTNINNQTTKSYDIFLQAGVYNVSAFLTATAKMKANRSNFLQFTITPAQIDTTIAVGLDQPHQDGDRWFLPGCGVCGSLAKSTATSDSASYGNWPNSFVEVGLTGKEPNLPLIIKSAHPNISISTGPTVQTWIPDTFGVVVVKYRTANSGPWQIILNSANQTNTTVSAVSSYQNILLQVPVTGLLNFQISFVPDPNSWWNPSSITETFLYFIPPALGRYLVSSATVVLNQVVYYYGSTWFTKNNIAGLEGFQGFVADNRAGMCNFTQNIVNNTTPPDDDPWISVGVISSEQPGRGFGSVVVENTAVIRLISAPDALQRRGRVQAILPCPFWWRESPDGIAGNGGGYGESAGAGAGAGAGGAPPPPPPS